MTLLNDIDTTIFEMSLFANMLSFFTAFLETLFLCAFTDTTAAVTVKVLLILVLIVTLCNFRILRTKT